MSVTHFKKNRRGSWMKIHNILVSLACCTFINMAMCMSDDDGEDSELSNKKPENFVEYQRGLRQTALIDTTISARLRNDSVKYTVSSNVRVTENGKELWKGRPTYSLLFHTDERKNNRYVDCTMDIYQGVEREEQDFDDEFYPSRHHQKRLECFILRYDFLRKLTLPANTGLLVTRTYFKTPLDDMLGSKTWVEEILGREERFTTDEVRQFLKSIQRDKSMTTLQFEDEPFSKRITNPKIDFISHSRQVLEDETNEWVREREDQNQFEKTTI